MRISDWSSDVCSSDLDAEIAKALGVEPAQVAELEAARVRGYHDGGFKVWDISDKSKPRLLCHQRTFGFGTHRFDMDADYAYISTERSEEHTSELQSLMRISYAVFCLQKKKKKIKNTTAVSKT